MLGPIQAQCQANLFQCPMLTSLPATSFKPQYQEYYPVVHWLRQLPEGHDTINAQQSNINHQTSFPPASKSGQDTPTLFPPSFSFRRTKKAPLSLPPHFFGNGTAPFRSNYHRTPPQVTFCHSLHRKDTDGIHLRTTAFPHSLIHSPAVRGPDHNHNHPP